MGETLTWHVVYHPKVPKEDLPVFSAKMKERIASAIEAKLTSQPELFGKPLRKSLKGYRSLRIDDVRIVYRLEGRKVIIVIIAHRSRVYERAIMRIL